MIKRLSVLNGIAILGVVLNHTAGYGQIALILWTDRYLPGPVPNWGQVGTFNYYLLLFLRQAAIFCVPAFLFVSGFFMAYAFKDRRPDLPDGVKLVWPKILSLLIPYLIWSAVFFTGTGLMNGFHPPLETLKLLVTSGAIGPYWFVPMLLYTYLLCPLFIPAARAHPKLALLAAGAIQLVSVLVRYAVLFSIHFPGRGLLFDLTPNWSPAQWIFFFVLGVAAQANLPSFKAFLERRRGWLLAALLLCLGLNLLESDWLLRTTHNSWGAYNGTLSFNLYAVASIFAFLALKDIPFAPRLAKLGLKSFGIYLVHYGPMMVLSKLVYHFAPRLLAYPLPYGLLLFTSGLGLPLFLMYFVKHSPARPAYRYLYT